jgi:hypothetical protein
MKIACCEPSRSEPRCYLSTSTASLASLEDVRETSPLPRTPRCVSAISINLHANLHVEGVPEGPEASLKRDFWVCDK